MKSLHKAQRNSCNIATFSIAVFYIVALKPHIYALTALSSAGYESTAGLSMSPGAPPWQGRSIASSKLRMLEFSAFLEQPQDPEAVSRRDKRYLCLIYTPKEFLLSKQKCILFIYYYYKVLEHWKVLLAGASDQKCFVPLIFFTIFFSQNCLVIVLACGNKTFFSNNFCITK